MALRTLKPGWSHQTTGLHKSRCTGGPAVCSLCHAPPVFSCWISLLLLVCDSIAIYFHVWCECVSIKSSVGSPCRSSLRRSSIFVASVEITRMWAGAGCLSRELRKKVLRDIRYTKRWNQKTTLWSTALPNYSYSRHTPLRLCDWLTFLIWWFLLCIGKRHPVPH